MKKNNTANINFNKKISIIIVNWNGKKWLKKCLDSIGSQTYPKIEIIIVDNASTDDSVKYIKMNYPKTKLLINKKNVGYPRAVNRGIDFATGEYILLLNNDVWMEKGFLEKIVTFYFKHEFTVISPIERRYDKSKDFKNHNTIDPTGSPAYRPTLKKSQPLFLSVCYFLSKKDYLSTLGFDNDYFAYYEDVDWFWRMALLGKKVSYVKDVFVYHKGAGSIGSGIKYQMFLWRNQNALQTIIKNYSSFSLIFILPLYFFQNIIEMTFFILILKPKLSISYVYGWMFNIRNLRKIKKKRKWIQKNRVVTDLEIFKRMYLGPSKLIMLLDYIK